jgi:hypothetical protein
LLHENDVVGQARHHAARGLARKSGEVGRDEMLERKLLHVGGNAHDDAVGRHRLQIEQNAANGRGDDDGRKHPAQLREVAAGERVERILQDFRIDGRGRGKQAR